MTLGMKLFLAGCVAELYVLILRRFYINGTMNQVVAWYDFLPWMGAAGLAVLAGGAVCAWVKKQNAVWLVNSGCAAGTGAFLALVSFSAHWNQSAVNLFSVLVPAVMLMCVFWSLYDRECSLALTILGVSLIAAWVCYRTEYRFSPYLMPIKVIVAVYLASLGVLASLVRAGRGKFLKMSDPLPVYAACALSALGMAAALFSAQAAWYAMWSLALVTFGLVVYYTVRQI